MTTVDDPIPDVARKRVFQHLQSRTTERTAKPTFERFDDDSVVRCENHYHAECEVCGTVKCLGATGYEPNEQITQLCDCERSNTVPHTVVPKDNFGRTVGYPQ